MKSFKLNNCIRKFRLFLLIAFFSIQISTNAQSVENYIKYRGRNIAEMTHVSNDFIRGNYLSHSGQYTDILILSKDNLFDRTITTKLRLVHGFMDLYFKDIVILSDNDVTNPFDAFGLQAALMASIVKNVDSKSYNSLKLKLRTEFGVDFESWTGKQWAIFALNLDYLDYISN